MNLGKTFEQYRKIRVASGISQATLESEYKCHKKLWQTMFIDDELKVTKQQVLDYAKLITSNNTYTENTKHQRIKGLFPFYNEAIKQGWLLASPMSGIKYPRKVETLPKVLSIKQVKQLLNTPNLKTIKGIRDRTMLELAYSCGLRASELLSVTNEMFHEDYIRLHITGKGNKEAVLPVGRMSAYFLRYYCTQLFPKLNKCNQNKLFLSTTTGKPLWDSAFRGILNQYGKTLGFKVSPHTIRYSVCTHLSDEGVDIRLIQEFMRHDSIETTARYIRQDFHKMQEIHKKSHPRENG